MARGRRLFVGSQLEPERLQPAASPVDAFVRTGEGSGLAQLAQSLSAVAPSLARFTAVMADQRNAEQAALGEQKARELHEARVTFNDAIKKGLIEEHQSPFFMAAFKQQSGRLAAGDYDAALRVAMSEDAGLQSSTDLGDFDAFESKFRQQWLAENVGDKNRDVHFEEGFGRMVDGFTLDAKRQFSQTLGARVKAQAGENLQREIGQILDLHAGESRPEAVEGINAVIKAYLMANPKGGTLANEKAAAAVLQYAEGLAQDGDPNAEETAVELLKTISAGPGSKLYGLPKVKAALSEMRDRIFQQSQARNRAARAEEDFLRAQEARAIFGDLNETLTSAADPGHVDLAPFLSRMAVIDPTPQARETLFKMQESFAQREYPVDDDVYADALMRVHGVHPEMPGFLSMKQASALLAGKQITPAQYNLLVNEIDQREQRAKAEGNRGAGNGSKLLSNRTYTLVSSILRSSMVSDYESSAEEKAAAAAAQIEFTKMFLQAAQSGQEPTFDEATKMANAAMSLYGLDETLEARENSRKRPFAGVESGGSTTDEVDVKKTPVVSRAQLEQLESDVRNGKLSGASEAILNQYGIGDGKSLREFIEAQRKLAR